MKALVWKGGATFQIEQMPRPEAGPGRIVVKVHAAAICGSDSHLADFGATPPVIPGHEVAGVIAEVGPDVRGLKAGDRVALDPVQKCGTCHPCTHGIPHLCTNYRHLGDRTIPGGWAEYVAIDAANAHPVPEGLDLVAASMVEPFAVCYESLQRAKLERDQSVLILGDGPFGFIHAQVARALGARQIIVAGHYDVRLNRIREATGAVVCNTHRQEIGKVLEDVAGADGVDVVIEATGAAASPDIGIGALRPRGTMIIFSYIWKPQPINMGAIHMKELNLLGSCRSLDGYAPVLRLLAEDRLNAAALVDLRVPLEDHPNAFRRIAGDKAGTFKVVFLPG